MSAASLRGESVGLVRFKLSDVPEWLRKNGADIAIKSESSPTVRVRISVAAECPSEEWYWIPRAAYDKTMQRRMPGGRKKRS